MSKLASILNSKFFPLLILLIAGSTLYSKTIFFDFLNFDDDYNILLNEAVKSFDLKAIWSQQYYGMYIPVVYTVWSLISQLSTNPSPMAFHLFNFFIHLFNAFQIYQLFIILSAKYDMKPKAEMKTGALLAALFFVCHPMQVEPVVWISATRDLLSVSFSLIAFRIYLAEVSAKNIFLATIFFSLGLLSKPSIATLPAVLFVADLILRQSTFKQSFIRLSSMFALSLVGIILASSIQADQISKRVTLVPIWEKGLTAINNFVFYVQKVVLPINLSADYGQVNSAVLDVGFAIQNVIVVVTLFLIFWFLWRRVNRLFQLGALIFVLTLAPSLGIVSFFYQSISSAADRYLYFPMVGLSLIVGSFCSSSWRKIFVIVVILIFGSLAYIRTEVWRNDKTFFTEIIASNPLSSAGHLGLGNYFASIKSFELSKHHLSKAGQLDPLNAVPHANLFLTMNWLGMHTLVIDGALRLLSNSEFIRINEQTEGLALLYITLGYAQFQIQDYENSLLSYCNSIIHNPASTIALEGLEKIKPYTNANSCP